MYNIKYKSYFRYLNIHIQYEQLLYTKNPLQFINNKLNLGSYHELQYNKASNKKISKISKYKSITTKYYTNDTLTFVNQQIDLTYI